MRSSLHDMKNLESVDQDIPIISSECRFPYFLYRTIGENYLKETGGVSNILSLFPVATAKNLESGENWIAVTWSLKLK